MPHWPSVFIGFGVLVASDVIALGVAFGIAVAAFGDASLGTAVALGGFASNRLLLGGVVAAWAPRGGFSSAGLAVALGTVIWLAWIATGQVGVSRLSLGLVGALVGVGAGGAGLGLFVRRVRMARG